MKILLTGVLPWSVWTIAERIAKGGHAVTVIGETAFIPERLPEGVTQVKLNQEKKETARYISASGFEAIIFFFAAQCEDRRKYGISQGKQLDLLFDVYYDSNNNSLEQFILVTDQRVFSDSQQGTEEEDPIPDTPTGVMMKAAESCVLFRPEGHDIRTLLVRTTSIYVPGDPTSFWGIARVRTQNRQEFVLHGSSDTPCDFLHAEDLGVFLEYAVSMELSGVAHVSQGTPATYGSVMEQVKARLPELSFSYMPGSSRRTVRPGKPASRIGWVPRHDFFREMDEIFDAELRLPQKKTKQQTKEKKIVGTLLKWLEIVGLAVVAVWLTTLGQNNALLATVDYMLLYVIIIGFVHGRNSGLIASLLACGWYGAAYLASGGQAQDLLFNTDHWLPMSVYIISGSMFGYARDRQQLRIDMLEKEKYEVQNELTFMEGMYRRTYEDRNQLKEQIYHSRDSYGRIYQITKELDTLQPVQVFLSALHVLENILQNKSVAIYECRPETSFIRLVVRSREMKSLPNSMNMKDYRPMYEDLKSGKLFANRMLLSGYPVYALPIMSGNELHAVLMLWSVPFEQQSMYMENLLSVVAGLAQSSLIRAVQYHNEIGHMYYENTHILMPEAFRSTLGIYQSIRQSRTGEHFLVHLVTGSRLSVEIADREIGKLVRSTDVVGCLEDGDYYVLFPQASAAQLPMIEKRFRRVGIDCEVVSEDISVE